VSVRVALSLDVQHKGKTVFDLSPLIANPDIEIGFVEPNDGIDRSPGMDQFTGGAVPPGLNDVGCDFS
jgi:hypothetical protein